MDFSSGVFAIFINDLQFIDSKIGDYKFYYDSISNEFIVKNKPELRYSRSAVVGEPRFLVFREIAAGADKEEFQLDFEVEPYEMQKD